MVDALVLAGLGAGIGLGIFVAALGVGGHSVMPTRPQAGRLLNATDASRVLVALLLGAVVLMLTRWAAAAALAAIGVWGLPRLLGGRTARDAAIAKTEAIAVWCEMVRDSIVAAAGLEEALCATGPIAPEPIADEVHALVARLRNQGWPLREALTAFSTDVHHPSADLVVAALSMAARMEVSDLSGVLTRLADSIRDDARMRIRVEVGRTRVRTAAMVVVAVVGATALMLVVASRDYLDVYDTPQGQVVLLAVGGIFALGGWLLERMAAVDLPRRFTIQAPEGAP